MKCHTPREGVKNDCVDFLNFNLIVLKESLVKASMRRSQGKNFDGKKKNILSTNVISAK